MTTNQLSPPTTLPVRHLDGATLEGGGQLLRVALSISALTRSPIHLTNIRGKRGPKSAPQKGGGLKPAHLAGVRWLVEASGAETEGMEEKSRELVFRPTGKTRNSFGPYGGEGETQVVPHRSISPTIWKEDFEYGPTVRLKSCIPMSSPGSIFLVFQAILPYILFGMPGTSSEVTPTCQGSDTSVQITIHGGTNVSKSPSFEYMNQVLLPMLMSKVNIPPISMKLNRRGWSQGKPDVGSVTFDVQPLRYGQCLPAFSFTDRRSVIKIHVSILAPDVNVRNSIRQTVMTRLLKRWPSVEILFPVDEDSKHAKRLYLLLVAETASGYRLGRDWLFDRNPGSHKAPDQLVQQVVDDLEQELDHGGCVDEYLQDQLVIFQTLADGRTVIDAGKGREASLHTRTVRWVMAQMLGVAFDVQGNCKGAGFRVGEEIIQNL